MAIKVLFSAGQETVIVQGLYQWDYGQTLEIECSDIGYEIMEVHFACPNMTMAIPRPCTFNNGVGTVPIPDQCLEQGEAITAWICRIDDIQSHTIKTITLPITKRTKPIRTHEVPEELVDKYSELIVEVTETVDALKSGTITVARAKQAENANMANTAKSAEYATYATSAGTANHANQTESAGAINMRLVASCTVTAGVGNVGIALEENTPYLVIYESSDGSVGSGVIVTHTKGVCGCGINVTHGALLNNWHYEPTHTVIITKADSSSIQGDTAMGGTVYIYTFGNIPE